MLRARKGPQTRPPSQPGLPELPVGLTLECTDGVVGLEAGALIQPASIRLTGAELIDAGMPSLRAEPSGITLPSLVPIQ